jgi:hypothetical protein
MPISPGGVRQCSSGAKMRMRLQDMVAGYDRRVVSQFEAEAALRRHLAR